MIEENVDASLLDSLVRLLIEPLRVLWWDGFRTGLLAGLVIVVFGLAVGFAARPKRD